MRNALTILLVVVATVAGASTALGDLPARAPPRRRHRAPVGRPGPPGRAGPLRAARRLGRALPGRPAAGAHQRRRALRRPRRGRQSSPARATSTPPSCARRRATRSSPSCAWRSSRPCSAAWRSARSSRSPRAATAAAAAHDARRSRPAPRCVRRGARRRPAAALERRQPAVLRQRARGADRAAGARRRSATPPDARRRDRRAARRDRRLVNAPANRAPLGSRLPRLTVASDLHNNVIALPALERAASGGPLLFAGDLHRSRLAAGAHARRCGSCAPARGSCSSRATTTPTRSSASSRGRRDRLDAQRAP